MNLMDRSAVIYLVSETYTQNDYGVLVPETQKRKIYADVSSVTGTEWFEGGRNGLNPEFRMRVFAPDYEGEKVIEYNNVQYTIYRTYLGRNDILELYVQRKMGNA